MAEIQALQQAIYARGEITVIKQENKCTIISKPRSFTSAVENTGKCEVMDNVMETIFGYMVMVSQTK